MARPLRINVENGWYHVFGRGTERRSIFTSERDREHFLELFAEVHERYRIVIHAYALLANHYHAIFQTPDANLPQAMQWLHGSYSTWFNIKHERVGPLFQGRYKAVRVENGAWAYALSLYVHLNPLRIADLGLDKQGRVAEGKGYRSPNPEQVAERLKRLRQYRWSSYRYYAGYAHGPDWLTRDELLRRAHREKRLREKAYRKDIRHRLSYGVESSQIERLRDAVAVGSAAFAKQARRVGVQRNLRGIGGKRELRRRVSAEDVRKGIEVLKGEPWEEIRGRHGDWGKALFLSTSRRICGLTLREIGAIAGGMEESAAGMAIKRFDQKARKDKSLREQQKALIEMLDVGT